MVQHQHDHDPSQAQASRLRHPSGTTDKPRLIPAALGHAWLCFCQLGKWHLGQLRVASVPTSRGFDTSFGYLGGDEVMQPTALGS
jgi:hypothetical protein